jgi:hypothetical protein
VDVLVTSLALSPLCFVDTLAFQLLLCRHCLKSGGTLVLFVYYPNTSAEPSASLLTELTSCFDKVQPLPKEDSMKNFVACHGFRGVRPSLAAELERMLADLYRGLPPSARSSSSSSPPPQWLSEVMRTNIKLIQTTTT